MTVKTKFLVGGLLIGALAAGFVAEVIKFTSSSVQYTPIIINYSDLGNLHKVMDDGTGNRINVYSSLHFYFQIDDTRNPAVVTLIPYMNSDKTPAPLPIINRLTPISLKTTRPFDLEGNKYDLPINLDNAGILVNKQISDLLALSSTYGNIDQFRFDPMIDQPTSTTDQVFYYKIVPLLNGNEVSTTGVDSRLLRLDPIPPKRPY